MISRSYESFVVLVREAVEAGRFREASVLNELAELDNHRLTEGRWTASN